MTAPLINLRGSTVRVVEQGVITVHIDAKRYGKTIKEPATTTSYDAVWVEDVKHG